MEKLKQGSRDSLMVSTHNQLRKTLSDNPIYAHDVGQPCDIPARCVFFLLRIYSLLFYDDMQVFSNKILIIQPLLVNL